jgi:tRNA pseudouridine38-40 synthase
LNGGRDRARRNLKLTVEYDGTLFHGWQQQPEVRTVEGVLRKELSTLTGEEVELNGASRTDRGVHAAGQVANFHTHSPIPADRFARVVNGRLPEDVRVLQVEEVLQDFHARFSAVGKRYRYSIDRSEVSNVFLARRTLHVPAPLDISSMREAAAHLLGEHDFAAFCCKSRGVEREQQTIRTVFRVAIEERQRLLYLDVLGSSFLYKMVRTIAGSLLEVGRGRWTPGELRDGLLSLQRNRVGPTLPARGLSLERVYYEVALLRAAARGSSECNSEDG